jgi:hypothetical protein
MYIVYSSFNFVMSMLKRTGFITLQSEYDPEVWPNLIAGDFSSSLASHLNVGL